MTSQIDSALETFTFPSKVDQAAIFGRRWLPPCGIRCTTAVTGWVHGRWHARGPASLPASRPPRAVTAALLSDVLQSQSTLAEANHQFQQALLDYWTARAEFEKALGE
jgi:hypothetical protein